MNSPDEVPLPQFRRPHHQQLDPSPDATEPAVVGRPELRTEDHPATEPVRPPEPIESSPATPAAGRTRTSATGDPKAAGKALAGLLVIALGIAGGLLARSGRNLRQPTPEQVADIANPIGAVAARHLPTEIIGPDLADFTTAAAAAHSYVLDPAGPLVTRTPAASYQEGE